MIKTLKLFSELQKARFFCFSTSCKVLAHLQEALGNVLCFSSFQFFQRCLDYILHLLLVVMVATCIKIKQQLKFGPFPLHKSGVNLQPAEGEMPY